LVSLYQGLLSIDKDSAVEIDMGYVEWFDADMCAPLASFLVSRKVSFANFKENVKKILSKKLIPRTIWL
jgi:hypothetical protein